MNTGFLESRNREDVCIQELPTGKKKRKGTLISFLFLTLNNYFTETFTFFFTFPDFIVI